MGNSYESIIEFNLKEKERLCNLLSKVGQVASGELSLHIWQARKIYCDVKARLQTITVTGNNIHKLLNLLADMKNLDSPLWVEEAVFVYKMVLKKYEAVS